MSLLGAPELRPSDAENLAGTETGRGHLSHSSITTQANCLKRFEWRYIHHLDLIERPRPLGMGKAFQYAIEKADPDAGAALLREGVLLHDQQAEDRLQVEEATVSAAAALYLRRFGTPENERREYEYRVRLRSPWTGSASRTFDLLGYADGVVDAGSWLELIENKFLGRIDALDVKKLPLDRQVSLAAYGLWRATGKQVRRVHYRIVRKPSIKQKKDESVGEFCERLTADYADPAREDFYSHSEELFRTADDLTVIEAELWDWASQRREAHRRNFYTRNTGHCIVGRCPYVPLCLGDPDAMSLYRNTRESEEAAA